MIVAGMEPSPEQSTPLRPSLLRSPRRCQVPCEWALGRGSAKPIALRRDRRERPRRGGRELDNRERGKRTRAVPGCCLFEPP